MKLKPANRERILAFAESLTDDYGDGYDVVIPADAEISANTERGIWVSAYVYVSVADLKESQS